MRVEYLELFIIKKIKKTLIFTDALGTEEGDRYYRPCPQFLRTKKRRKYALASSTIATFSFTHSNFKM